MSPGCIDYGQSMDVRLANFNFLVVTSAGWNYDNYAEHVRDLSSEKKTYPVNSMSYFALSITNIEQLDIDN